MRDERLYLDDIIVAADDIGSFIQGHDESSFEKNNMTRSATLFELLIIGEAASKISTSLRILHPEVQWSDVVAFRNSPFMSTSP